MRGKEIERGREREREEEREVERKIESTRKGYVCIGGGMGGKRDKHGQGK